MDRRVSHAAVLVAAFSLSMTVTPEAAVRASASAGFQLLADSVESAAALRSLGGARLAAGQFAGAVDALEAALRLTPLDDDIYRTLADVFLRLRLPGDAETVLTRAAQAIPDFVPDGNRLADIGTLYLTLGRWGRALDAFERAIAMEGIRDQDLVYKRIGAVRACGRLSSHEPVSGGRGGGAGGIGDRA